MFFLNFEVLLCNVQIKLSKSYHQQYTCIRYLHTKQEISSGAIIINKVICNLINSLPAA